MTATLPDIAVAATKLKDANRPISVRSIREILGGGSPNLLAKLLREWRGAQLQFPHASAAPAQMVAEVASVAPRIWTVALEEARAHVQVNTDQLTVALQDANAATDEIQGLLDESVTQLDQAREERQRAISAAEAMHARCAALDSQLEQQTLLLIEAHDSLKRQQEAAERLTSLLSRSEEIRTRERGDYQNELLQYNLIITDLRNQITIKDASAAAADVRADQQVVEIQLLRERVSGLHQQASSITQDLAVKEALHQEQTGFHLRETRAIEDQKQVLISQIGIMLIARDAAEREIANNTIVHTYFKEQQLSIDQITSRLTEIVTLVSPPPDPMGADS